MLTTKLLPSEWPKDRNYVDPPESQYLVPVQGLFWALSTAAVLFRLALRVNHKAGGLGLDDAFIVPGLLAYSGMFAITFYLQRYGIGRQPWNVQTPEIVKISRLLYYYTIFWFAASCLVKVSILLFFRRLSSPKKVWKWVIIAAIVFTVGWSLGLCLNIAFGCSPPRAYWWTASEEWVKTHDFACHFTDVTNLLAGTFSIVSDFYVVAFPCFLVLRLSFLTKSQRIGMMALFGSGMGVVVVGIIRTIITWNNGDGFRIGFQLYTNQVMRYCVASAVEVGMGIILACLPSAHYSWVRHISPTVRKVTSRVRLASGSSGASGEKSGEKATGSERAGTKHSSDTSPSRSDGAGRSNRSDTRLVDQPPVPAWTPPVPTADHSLDVDDRYQHGPQTEIAGPRGAVPAGQPQRRAL